MKIFTKVAAVICFFIQFSIMSFGQVADSTQVGIFNKGNWELNFSASIGNLTTSSSSSNSGAYGSSSDSKSSSTFYIQLGVIPAYFFTDDLSFEPEINVFIQSQEGAKPSLSFLGNLAYNFNLPQKNFVPFVRIGYGISNSLQIPVVIGILGRVSDDLNVSILNAGAGLKVVISKNVLLRTEINFRRYGYKVENNYSYYQSSYDYSITSVSGIFGFSILL